MGSKKCVVLVEDNAEMRRFVSTALQCSGYEVHESESGELGLAMAVGLEPDLVILDVMLSGCMDGLSVCHAIRINKRISRTPVLMISGLDQENDIAAGKLYGADVYLTKPISISKLLDGASKAVSGEKILESKCS